MGLRLRRMTAFLFPAPTTTYWQDTVDGKQCSEKIRTSSHDHACDVRGDHTAHVCACTFRWFR